jgi:acetate---CoA ligase (ADP-forming) subunit beta
MDCLTYVKSKELLDKYKISFCRSFVVKTNEEAIAKANELGYPVALKNFSVNAIHKSEVGKVKVNIRDDSELILVLGSFEEGETVIQEMLTGTEIILGMKKDPQFGPVIMFGLGGIFVEVLRDISLRVAPVNLENALAMLREIKGFKILEGIRGRRPVNISKIAETITCLSNLALNEPGIKEIDLNPLFVDENRILAVDARFIL